MANTDYSTALHGLRQDSLAAMLALVGLLKALDKSVPDWEPKSRWDGGGAVLQMSVDASAENVAKSAARGIVEMGQRMKIGKKKLDGIDPEEMAGMLGSTDANVVASLISDGALSKGGKMKTSLLCLTPGSGQQYFGKDFDAAVGMQESEMADSIRDGLFTSWDRKEKKRTGKGRGAFRLDWRERRKHALRATDPVSFKAPATGAEPLVALGIVEFTSAPEHGTLATTGCERLGRTVAWPIWKRPLSLSAVRVLIGMAELRRIAKDSEALRSDKDSARAHDRDREKDIAKCAEAMRRYGAERVMVARIFNDERFRTVGRGRQV